MSLEHAVSASYALQTAKLDNIFIQRIVIQMLGKAKRFLITTEIWETLTIRSAREHIPAHYCDTCRKSVQMVTLESVVKISGLSVVEIVRHIEGGWMHLNATTGSGARICLRPLFSMHHGHLEPKENGNAKN